MAGGDQAILKDARKKAKDKFAGYIADQLLGAAEAAAGRTLSGRDREAVLGMAAIVSDMAIFISEEVAGGKAPSLTSVVKLMNAKIKRLGTISDSNATLCVTASVDLAFKLVTHYPAMVAASNGAIVATGIGVATGGAGLLFAAGAWGVVAVAAYLIFASASDVALRCSAVAEERWLTGPPDVPTALRPAVPLNRQTDLIFLHLEGWSQRGPACFAP